MRDRAARKPATLVDGQHVGTRSRAIGERHGHGHRGSTAARSGQGGRAARAADRPAREGVARRSRRPDRRRVPRDPSAALDVRHPAAGARRRGLDANIARMAAWCADSGVDPAPHGKTTMAPALWDRQLAAGAWGITLATPSQVRVGLAFGLRRVVLANALVDPVGLAEISRALDAEPGLQVLSWVDSPDTVAAMDRVLAEVAPARPLTVLVELDLRDTARVPADSRRRARSPPPWWRARTCSWAASPATRARWPPTPPPRGSPPSAATCTSWPRCTPSWPAPSRPTRWSSPRAAAPTSTTSSPCSVRSRLPAPGCCCARVLRDP